MPDTEPKVKCCPSCGGAMEFHIGKQKIVCKYCNTELESPLTGKTIQKQDFNFATRGGAMQEEWEHTVRVLACGQCGAEVAAAANLTSVSCRYCGSSQMLESPNKAGIAPEALIPFKAQKHDALAIFSKWLKKRFFAPGALKTLAQQDKLTAVYSPFLIFDAYAAGNYTGEGCRNHKETYRDKDGKTQTKTTTTWHHVRGTVSQVFKDILICAGQAGAKLLGKMKTFDLGRELIPFESAYLTGFMAETYTVSHEQGFEAAKEKILSELKGQAERQIRKGYGEARNVCVNAVFSDVRFMRVLLPVWFSGFTYRGKSFTVTINGATGEIQGEYPKSAAKIAILIGVIIALIAAAAFI